MGKPTVRQESEKFGKDIGLFHEVFVTGSKVGADQKFWAKIAHNESLFREIVDFVDRDGFEATTSQKLARTIMGKNFFGIEEAIKHFGVKPTKTQLKLLAEVPFTEGVMEFHKDTHVLVAVFPFSVLDVRKVNIGLFHNSSGGWFESEKFAKLKGKVGWYLVQKTPVENSTSKNWDEQQALLYENEETPTSQVMVYTIIGYYKATGERLFKNIYVRCSDIDSSDCRVGVGVFDWAGLLVSYSLGDHHYNLGVSTSRKSI